MIDMAPIGGRQRDYLNACGMAKGQPGSCYGCAGELPKGRRRWCSEDCRVAFEGNHYWAVARWLALKQAGDVRSRGALCRRCGSDGRIPKGRCRCSHPWPCDRAGEPLYAYEGQVIDEHTLRHEQAYERALEVNHRIPRNGRGYEPGCHHHQAGLEVLCRSCHVAETRKQHLGRKLARHLEVLTRIRSGALEVRYLPPRPGRPPEAVSLPLWEDVA